MAHLQPKSAHGLQSKKEFKPAEHASIEKENRTGHDEKASEVKVTKDVSHSTHAIGDEVSWQLKFVLGVIAAGVLMLILKTVGLL